MSNAHDILADHYKAVRARMGMAGNRPARREEPFREPLTKAPAGIFAVPAQKMQRMRERKIAAERSEKVTNLLKCLDARIPREHFGMSPSATAAPIAEVQRLVAEHFEMTVPELLSKSRTMRVVLARQIAIYLARLVSRHSLVVIGNCFVMDHATVIYSIRRIDALIGENDAVGTLISTLKTRLVGNDCSIYYGA